MCTFIHFFIYFFQSNKQGWTVIEPLLVLPEPYGPIVGQVVHGISLKSDST